MSSTSRRAHFLTFLTLSASFASLVNAEAPRWFESAANARAGYDSNVTAIAADLPGTTYESSGWLSAGVSAGADFVAAGLLKAPWSAARLTWTADLYRFEDAAQENYVANKLAFSAKRQAPTNTVVADLSVARINGSKTTEISTPGCNAFGLPVWRERRTQWQERAKVQWTHLPAPLGSRFTAATTRFDMGTETRAGRVAFVDRADSCVTGEVGTAKGTDSLWVGVQLGRQHQDPIALPGGEYEYSNNYYRLTGNLARKLGKTLKASLTGGPDWSRYNGRVNPAILPDRSRNSWFADAELTWDVTPTWALVGKFSRFLALSSTGKSAYVDVGYEGAVQYKPSKTVQARLGLKWQQADYFPAAREDRVVAALATVDVAVTPRFRCGADVQYQYGWSDLQPVLARDFDRTFIALRATWVL
jgi:hypothetical protein